MAKIAFMDLEYYGNTPNGDIDNVFKVGIVISSGANKQGSTKEFKFEKEEDRDQKICEILKSNNIDCVCGHNIVDFDRTKLDEKIFENRKVIDTLFLSMLLEPTYLDHKLEKPYRKTDEINYESNSLSRYLINLKDNRTETIINDPILDAEESKNLFEKLDKKFDGLSERLKNTFAYLLSDDKHFQGYFNYKGIKKPNSINIYRNLKDEIVNTENGNKKKFLGAICDEVKFNELSRQNPTAFAFALAFIFFNDNYSAISSIILKKYPNVMRILKEIRFDLQKIDALELSKDIFEGIDEFKEFETIDGSSKISQKQIVDSALRDESFIAVLPTGAGKTYTFQLPALIKASIYKPLTIVISPLQALMKDQVENFAQKKGSKKFKIYASSGYLSYYEKQVVLKGVRDGSVDILYIAPESLRSEMVFNAISKRYIDRFVIDEAHCISTWGHDFRHDYFYIAKAIKELKGRDYQDKIAVSCFTATAKREVIDEIKEYFKKELDLDLKEFIASPKRKNLKYEAIKINNDDEKDTEKFKCLVNEIKELMKRNGGKIVPTIIYLPSSAEGCRDLSEKLSEKFLKLKIEPFYAKLDEEEGEGKKNKILKEFKEGEIDIVVATTAFGMGIDKGDIGAVIHYMLSDSLESYMQESGRGARDEKKTKEADCIILYDTKDFEYSKDMLLKNQITIQNIINVLKKIRELFGDRKDTEEIKLRDLIEAAEFDERGTKKSSFEIKQNKINTVLAELEKAGFISRLRDVYHITQPDETKYKIDEINGLTNDEKEKAKRIIAYIREKSSIDMQELLDVFGIDGSEDSSDNQKNSIKGFDKLLDKLEQEGILSKGHNDISAYIEKKGAISKLEELIKEENKILEKLTKKEFNQKKRA
jgi:ATP-dependent DNA helicase, recQ family